MIDRNVIIGARVRAARKAKGKSLEQLACELPEPMSFQQLACYEKGARWPATLLADVADTLGIQITTLLEKPA